MKSNLDFKTINFVLEYLSCPYVHNLDISGLPRRHPIWEFILTRWVRITRWRYYFLYVSKLHRLHNWILSRQSIFDFWCMLHSWSLSKCSWQNLVFVKLALILSKVHTGVQWLWHFDRIEATKQLKPCPVAACHFLLTSSSDDLSIFLSELRPVKREHRWVLYLYRRGWIRPPHDGWDFPTRRQSSIIVSLWYFNYFVNVNCF